MPEAGREHEDKASDHFLKGEHGTVDSEATEPTRTSGKPANDARATNRRVDNGDDVLELSLEVLVDETRWAARGKAR